MAVSLTPEQNTLLHTVIEPLTGMEKHRKPFETQWNRDYALYRGWSDWNENSTRAERDRDLGLTGEKREWGAELVIRIVYSTIETLLPKMVIHRPRMLILPRDTVASGNVRNMRTLVDWQQQQIDYELKLQTVVKDGLIYGLGVQKVWWHTDIRKEQPYLKPPTMVEEGQDPKWVVGHRNEVRFNDPMAAAIDPFDFYWPAHAYDIDRCGKVIERSWVTDAEVMAKIQSGEWCAEVHKDGTPTGLPVLTAEDVHSLSGDQKYAEAWQDRKKAEGRGTVDLHQGHIHEVHTMYDETPSAEYPHGKITVVLDRQIPVQCGKFPYWHGQLPYQVCRPTEDTHRMVGISEAEVLEDYQEELSTLRGQRRDAATLALNLPILYQEGLVDPLDLKFGPGMASPVNGPPNELVQQLRIQDVPNSAYQEETAIKQDAEIVSGVSDAVRGNDQGAGGDTATGAQLIHATANHRIRLKTLRCETEVAKRAAYQWVRLNQQKILSKEIPAPPRPPDPEQPGEEVWDTLQLSPAELAGTFAVMPEGGSTAPVNVQEKLQRAQTLWNLFRDNPQFDQRALGQKVLELAGEDRAEAFMTPPQPGVPVEALEALERLGVQKELIELAVEMSQQRPAQAQDSGRNGDVPAGIS